MKSTPLLYPSIIAAIGIVILGLLAAHEGIPPIPGQKLQSPKAAALASAAGKAMASATTNVITVVTNQGVIAADFQATQIQGLRAGFVYRAGMTMTNGWKVLGTAPYPTNGGTVSMQFSGTNLPALYFKAFYQFANPTNY